MVYEPISLASRFDSYEDEPNRAGHRGRWTLNGPEGNEVELGLPAYSRMLRHLELEDGLSEHLISSFANYGIPWIGASQNALHDQPMRMATVSIDSPVDVSQLVTASAIQFQFFGKSQSNLLPTSFSYWKPGASYEIATPEQMMKKVSAVREMIPKGVPVGAAIIAESHTVYDDVRFLIDCGFDYVELIAGSVTQLKPGSWIEFEADVAACVNLAVKARRDSRASAKLWLSAPIVQARDWLPFLRSGIDACCIDSFIANRRPVEPVATTSFAGIKVVTQSKFEWIVGVLREFQNSFLDVHNFYSN
ncbi:MAG: hypothetical protein ACK5PB_00190 [Pirellula sp.]|jgi:hypothetical protein